MICVASKTSEVVQHAVPSIFVGSRGWSHVIEGVSSGKHWLMLNKNMYFEQCNLSNCRLIPMKKL